MIACPSCDAPVSGDLVRPSRKVAVCPACDATVRLEREGEGWRAIGFTAPAAPEGLTVEVDAPPARRGGGYRDAISEPGRLLVTRRWWTPAVIFLTFFVIAWDSFLIFWYSTALFGVGASAGGFGIVMIVFPLAHVAAGVGLTWWVLATWLNRTRVEVSAGRLSCTHGPVPWPFGRPQPVALESVELFEFEEVQPKFNNKGRSATGRSWRVLARTRDGRKIPVVTRLADEAQARFLARRLDQQLT